MATAAQPPQRGMFFEEITEGFSIASQGRTITETDIVLHAGQTGDFYPHHMDAEWCRTQPFGQRIAHGTLIFSIVSRAMRIRSIPSKPGVISLPCLESITASRHGLV